LHPPKLGEEQVKSVSPVPTRDNPIFRLAPYGISNQDFSKKIAAKLADFRKTQRQKVIEKDSAV
jgi:hypothetical protein